MCAIKVRFSFLISDCFQENKALYKYSLSKQGNISSAENCQKFCQSDDKCSAFHYRTDIKVCYLKSPPKRFLGIVQLRDAKNTVFGPKFCPGNALLKESLGTI